MFYPSILIVSFHVNILSISNSSWCAVCDVSSMFIFLQMSSQVCPNVNFPIDLQCHFHYKPKSCEYTHLFQTFHTLPMICLFQCQNQTILIIDVLCCIFVSDSASVPLLLFFPQNFTECSCLFIFPYELQSHLIQLSFQNSCYFCLLCQILTKFIEN